MVDTAYRMLTRARSNACASLRTGQVLVVSWLCLRPSRKHLTYVLLFRSRESERTVVDCISHNVRIVSSFSIFSNKLQSSVFCTVDRSVEKKDHRVTVHLERRALERSSREPQLCVDAMQVLREVNVHTGTPAVSAALL